MFAITRSGDQSVVIDDSIEIKVREVSADSCNIEVICKGEISPRRGASYRELFDINPAELKNLILLKGDIVSLTEDIYFLIMQIKDYRIRLGVVCPDHYLVNSREILDASLGEDRDNGGP